ncbi:MAG: PAS domain S-box protein [Thainema sp.]
MSVFSLVKLGLSMSWVRSQQMSLFLSGCQLLRYKQDAKQRANPRQRHWCWLGLFSVGLVLSGLYGLLLVSVFPGIEPSVAHALATHQTTPSVVPTPQAQAPLAVTAVIPANFPPQYAVSDDGVPTGFAIDVMDEIADLASLNVTYQVESNWPTVQAAFLAGEADLIPNFGILAERQAQMAFTSPIETCSVAIAVRRATPNIATLDDLVNHPVAVVQTNVAQSILADYNQAHGANGRIEMITVDTPEAALLHLLAGEVDAVIYPEPVFLKLARQARVEQRIKIVGAPLQEVKRAIAVQPDQPALLQRLDQAVQQFIDTAQYRAIYQQWYGTPTPFWTIHRITWVMMTLFLVLLASCTVWRDLTLARFNRKLRREVEQRQQSEAQLRDSEERFRATFEQVAVGVAEVALSGQLLQVNQKICHILGYELDKLLQLTFHEITHSDDLACDQQHIQALLVEPQKPDYLTEKRCIRRDGSSVWTHLTLSLVRSAAGEPKYFVAVIEDISDRKRLQEERDRFFTMPIEMLCVVSMDGYFKQVNPAFQRILGYDDAELLAHLFLDFVHPDDQGKTLAELEKLARGQKTYHFENRYRHQDGSYRWLAWIAMPEPENGYIYGAARDITEQKQRQDAIRRQVERDQLLSTVAQRIRHSLDLNQVLNTTVAEVRSFLKTDRVILYRFDANWSGTVAVESVQAGWTSIRHQPFRGDWFATQQAQYSQQGMIQAIANVETAPLPMAYRQFLTRCQTKACLVIPVLQEDQHQRDRLWGMLVAQHCSAPRSWRSEEIEFLQQLALQVSIAIQQSELYQQVQQLNANLEQQVQQRTQQLEQALLFEALLKRITDKVRDSLDEQQILHSAVWELAEALQVVACNTALYQLPELPDAAIQHSAPQAASVSIPQRPVPLAVQVLDEYQGNLSLQEYHVVLPVERYPEIYQQLSDGQAFQFCTLLTDQPREWMCIVVCPIVDNNQTIGDLLLMRPVDAPFDAVEIRLIQQIANQCAIAIRQARLYQAAQAQVKALEKLNQLKDDFLSTVSHELRTPMANIKMATHMLAIMLHQLSSITRTNRIEQYLRILKDECDRELSLINDLLDLSRLQSNQKQPNPTTFDLGIWLSYVVPPFVERAESQQQTFQLELPSQAIVLTTDAADLDRIVAELLNNACKYTPAQETITVHLALTTDSNQVELTISNTGTEIAAAERERIFDKFYRVPNNDPWKHGGTGLGLALVKQLVEHLSGTIHVSSPPQQVIFTIRLPRAISPPETDLPKPTQLLNSKYCSAKNVGTF